MRILRTLKRRFYFAGAGYFAFFARKVLRRWKPLVVVVTGSSGKTTLLHMIETQLGKEALYSHKANSAYGVPFNILGLERKTFSFVEWPALFLKAPFVAQRTVPSQKIYVVEADAERPREAAFIAELVHPDIAIWLSLSEAHAASYDKLVVAGARENVTQAIAEEYGAILQKTKTLVIIDEDNPHIVEQTRRTHARVMSVSKKSISEYKLERGRTIYAAEGKIYSVPALLPREAGLSVLAVALLMDFLKKPFDYFFTSFSLPPGRSSVFEGIRKTTLIDSTYNATAEGMAAMLNLFKVYPAHEKWLVLGDMIEQGVSEAKEHAKLAEEIMKVKPERIVLVGPRLRLHAYPQLSKIFHEDVVVFDMPKDALQYLQKEIKGGETILFKGARFLEGIVEHLLLNPEDVAKLCRREAVWVNRRKKWGL